ncbi:MAG: hypothetical protein FIB01_15385 [Gemmatimonadetes bacterium]|nr:hypothetical protein [Gemmatimonadota bacterium]
MAAAAGARRDPGAGGREGRLQGQPDRAGLAGPGSAQPAAGRGALGGPAAGEGGAEREPEPGGGAGGERLPGQDPEAGSECAAAQRHRVLAAREVRRRGVREGHPGGGDQGAGDAAASPAHHPHAGWRNPGAAAPAAGAADPAGRRQLSGAGTRSPRGDITGAGARGRRPVSFEPTAFPMRLHKLLLLFSALLPLPLAAQQTTPPAAAGGERVGYIVAVVADSAITNVALMDGMVQYFAMQNRPPVFSGPEAERARQEVLDNVITELLLLQAAAKDTTIKVDDERLRRGVEQQLSERQRQAGGAAQFDRVLRQNGTTQAEYREYLTAEIRKNDIVGQYMSHVRQKRKPPPVSERELKAYFEQNRQLLETQWGAKPALVTLDQIVLPILPADSADAAARTRADSVFLLVQQGEKFEELAKRFTEEPGGRERGGDLGWIKESDVVRDFARVTFSTPPGAISAPFRSSYGWHILQVERRRGAEAKVRHILFMPGVTDADLERALQRGDSIAEQLKQGAAVAPLARQYGDADFDVRIGPVPPDTYQQNYQVDVASSKAGDVVGPAPFGEGPAKRLLVARVVERTPAGSWSLDDQQARDALQQQLAQQALMKELVAELRRSIYVKVFEQ